MAPSTTARLIALMLLITLPSCAEVDSAVNRPLLFEPWTDIATQYRFRPGDEIDVRLLYNPEISDRVRIGPDGRISLALIGTVQAEGRTSDELSTDLLARFGRELRRPDVVVIGRQFDGQRIYVGGEVRSPGVVTIPGRVGVMEAVIAAGGFKETARTAQLVLMRRGPGGRPMLRTVDTDSLTYAGTQSEDVPLQGGDLVIVPRSPIARLDLFMDQYFRQALPFEKSFVYSITQGSTGGIVR